MDRNKECTWAGDSIRLEAGGRRLLAAIGGRDRKAILDVVAQLESGETREQDDQNDGIGLIKRKPYGVAKS